MEIGPKLHSVLGPVSGKFRCEAPSLLLAFLNSCRYSCYYIDVTGLPHHVWAPFLRVFKQRSELVYCVYVEPGDYRLSEKPTESTIFDLSERIEGVSPLPGFASFPRAGYEEALFVPLLGFEGTRFGHMIEHVQPNRDLIFPIIGVPGFRAEYPFYSYVGNRSQLEDTGAWQNVRFVSANCPFALYYLLMNLSSVSPRSTNDCRDDWHKAPCSRSGAVLSRFSE